jgi:hypothetical protein
VAHPYVQIARDHSLPRGRMWLDQVLTAAGGARRADRLLAAYAGARRRLGDAPVESPPGWTCDEVGRAALLYEALIADPHADHAALVDGVFRKGDTAERRALLRALCLLPDPARFAPTAIEACRTNVVPVFEAIACDNDFPERWFPDEAFNQLVLKALFLEVPLARVRGLAARAQGELARMALDYAAERRAAGRSVPADLARIPGCELATLASGSLRAPKRLPGETP